VIPTLGIQKIPLPTAHFNISQKAAPVFSWTAFAKLLYTFNNLYGLTLISPLMLARVAARRCPGSDELWRLAGHGGGPAAEHHLDVHLTFS
jgi:hypothetical protein